MPAKKFNSIYFSKWLRKLHNAEMPSPLEERIRKGVHATDCACYRCVKSLKEANTTTRL